MESKPAVPEYDHTLVGVHNRLFFRLFQVGNVFQKQTAKQLGITTVQWAVLGALTRPQASTGMSVTELAEFLVVSRQNLDGVLTRLERDQHVSRVADTVDRRSKRVQVTAQGALFWEQLQPRIYEFYRQAITNFRFDDKVSFVHFLNKLQDDLKQVDLDHTHGPANGTPAGAPDADAA
ncbi:MAG: MarR family transcriptional regulator [Pseudomonadota bacterium]